LGSGAFWKKLAEVRKAGFIGLFVIALTCAGAQEIELPPLVVTGTFELRQRPSVPDLFMKHLERQLDVRRDIEQTMARSPWYYSRFWKYMVIPLGSSQDDSLQFFMPHYLSADYRNTERALQESQKQSLFERR
jgi:hypothetical protein